MNAGAFITANNNLAHCERTAMHGKTLVFCTSYVAPAKAGPDAWISRYKPWLQMIRESALEYDQILLVDDGSAAMPDWPDLIVTREGETPPSAAKLLLYRFHQRLGRRGVSDFPGWVRSFLWVPQYAEAHGFNRVLHIESDACVISPRIQEYFNKINEGWVALHCPRYDRPESGIQLIAGNAMKRYRELSDCHYEQFANTVIETSLPFTTVERKFRGDRYGDFLDYVPLYADWSTQSMPKDGVDPFHFRWWLNERPARAFTSNCTKSLGDAIKHDGIYYLELMSALDRQLKPRSYFEIGTNAGHSLGKWSCHSVSVDPKFAFDGDPLGGKPRAYFFQTTSDKFFLENDLRLLLPGGFDVAFLDGLHLFEALYQAPYRMTEFAQGRRVMEATRSGIRMSLFQALRHALRIAS